MADFKSLMKSLENRKLGIIPDDNAGLLSKALDAIRIDALKKEEESDPSEDDMMISERNREMQKLSPTGGEYQSPTKYSQEELEKKNRFSKIKALMGK